MSDLEKTDEQLAILEHTQASQDDVLIDALAGTGKTWLLLEALRTIPQRSILLSAFNKRIAGELRERLPPLPRSHVVHIETFHALGLKVLTSKFGHLKVEKTATENLVNQVGIGASFQIRRAATRLLKTYKETRCPSTPEVNELEEVGTNHQLFGKLTDPQIDEALTIAFDAYVLGKDFAKRVEIDFCDMVWGVIVAEIIPPSRYQLVAVDELQDLSWPQFHLLMRLIAPNGRFIGIGDPKQDIYQWRESIGAKAWAAVKVRPGTKGMKTFPLSTTFRSAKRIVAEANRLVPALRATQDAPEGLVRTISFHKLFDDLHEVLPVGENEINYVFVLSRSNALLLSCALQLYQAQWQQAVRRTLDFSIAGGKELFEPLYDVLDKLQTGGHRFLFEQSLNTWYLAEKAKAEKSGSASRADTVEDHYLMLLAASAYTQPSKIKSLLMKLAGFDGESPLTLSTVHKVKGLEADRVYLLRESFFRYQDRKDKEGNKLPVPEEENNVEYVAITRAKFELVWVEGCA